MKRIRRVQRQDEQMAAPSRPGGPSLASQAMQRFASKTVARGALPQPKPYGAQRPAGQRSVGGKGLRPQHSPPPKPTPRPGILGKIVQTGTRRLVSKAMQPATAAKAAKAAKASAPMVNPTTRAMTASNEEKTLLAFVQLQEALLHEGRGMLTECMGDSVYSDLFQKAMEAETYLGKAYFHRKAGRRAMQLGDELRASRHGALADAYGQLDARNRAAAALPAAVLNVSTPDKELQAKGSVADLDAAISKGRYREFAFPYGEFRNKAAMLMSAPKNWDGRSEVGAVMVAYKGKWQLVSPLPDSLMSKQMLKALQHQTGLVGFYLGTWKLDSEGNAVRYIDLSANPMTLLQSLLKFPQEND